jgi:hypothetical protein
MVVLYLKDVTRLLACYYRLLVCSANPLATFASLPFDLNAYDEQPFRSDNSHLPATTFSFLLHLLGHSSLL